MESENLKERIITKSEKIQELLDCIAEIKKNNLFLDKLKILESKCYDIISNKCFIKWHRRLRQKKINDKKIRKKGLIFKIK